MVNWILYEGQENLVYHSVGKKMQLNATKWFMKPCGLLQQTSALCMAYPSNRLQKYGYNREVPLAIEVSKSSQFHSQILLLFDI